MSYYTETRGLVKKKQVDLGLSISNIEENNYNFNYLLMAAILNFE